VPQLWADLQDLFRRTKPDFDPTTPRARAAWRAANDVPGPEKPHSTRRTSTKSTRRRVVAQRA